MMAGKLRLRREFWSLLGLLKGSDLGHFAALKAFYDYCLRSYEMEIILYLRISCFGFGLLHFSGICSEFWMVVGDVFGLWASLHDFWGYSPMSKDKGGKRTKTINRPVFTYFI